MPAGSCVRSLQLGRFLSARSFTLHPTCPAPASAPPPGTGGPCPLEADGWREVGPERELVPRAATVWD